MPNLLKKAALCQTLGILMLLVSLFCHTAIPYLITIGVGSTLILLGFVVGLIDLAKHWRTSQE